MNLSVSLAENEKKIDELFQDCQDILKRELYLGVEDGRRALIYYVEVTVTNMILQDSTIGRMIGHLWDVPQEEQLDYLRKNAVAASDVKLLKTFDEVTMGVLVGDAVLLVEGLDRGIKIKSAGYPRMNVEPSQNEMVMRGSKEGFTDSIKGNTALVRKRIRNTDLKVQEMIVGEKTQTTTALVYMGSLVRPQVLNEIKKRMQQLSTDGILDSGIIEQMTEFVPASPFPQYQTTERPDRAAQAVLEGRILLLSDNSPVGLLLPTNFAAFFRTADDYYNRTEVVALERILRFLAAFVAIGLPGLYLAVISFHQEILPTSFLLALAEGRAGVPVPAVVEVLMMELAFELLREAGVRVPGSMGNAIGVVGGLIIGEAAVSAGLVSPIIVIVVALTALASFAIPNDEMASAFRVLKYVLIGLAAVFGLFGWFLGIAGVIIHLAKLTSFQFPYLYPIVCGELNEDADKKDLWIRYPLGRLKRRSIYTKIGARSKIASQNGTQTDRKEKK
ncbi:MAG: spore germination protein [Lachnospiraceae bacterium]|nr:spore germination protein [Lachnospiraceae bacterium]